MRLLRWLIAGFLFLIGSRRRRQEEEHAAERPTSPAEPTERQVGSSPRAEGAVVGLLLASALAGAGFIVFYVVRPDTQFLGLTLGLAVGLLAAAVIIVGKRVVPQETAIEERSERMATPGEDEAVDRLVREAGEGITRRGAVLGAAGIAGGTLGAAALFPLASIGPRVEDTIYRTPWSRGRRVVSEHGKPITAEEVEEGTFLTGFPEGVSPSRELGAPIILVREPPEKLKLKPERRRGAPEGIMGYSKICPHAGCALSIYRHPLYAPTQPGPVLVCPCHYSTFDVRRGGFVVFGPAARDLPQLPLRINEKRELEADGDYYDAIGPSWGGVRQRPG